MVGTRAGANPRERVVVRKQVEGSLGMPKGQVRAAFQALDDAAAAGLETRQRLATRRH
jgi:hypothetical protein